MRRAAALVVLVLAVGAAAVLGALAYRAAGGEGSSSDPASADAIAHFEASHASGATAADRRRAEAAARRLHERGADAAARAVGANLLGVLAFENATLDPARAEAHVAASAAAFRDAIRLDPGADDAKFNLELVLTLAPEEAGAETGAGSLAGPSTGSGAGATPPGAGY
jgi:hypothetical protein